MKINFYATLRQIVGGKAVDLPAGDSLTVQELIDQIISRYPRLRPELVDEEGHLYGHIHLFVNGRDVQYLTGGLGTRITDDDTVSIFPAIGGGSAPA